ncbi:hypothetical protein ACHAWF_003733 [Thalassiosira exigua]
MHQLLVKKDCNEMKMLPFMKLIPNWSYILQPWVYDQMFILTITSTSKQSECMSFLPVPHGGICYNRSMNAQILPESVAEDTVEFHSETSSKSVCIVCAASNPLHLQVTELFNEYPDLAQKLYLLCQLMKSQEKLNPDAFDAAALDFILAWNAVFPEEPYFNKLHFVMMHLPDFVEEYHICGRASAESRGSVYVRFSRRKESVSRMVSTVQRYKTLFSRSVTNLRGGIAEKQAVVREKKENKRGKYNIARTTKRNNQIDLSSSIFSGRETIGNEVFLLLIDSGRLPERASDEPVAVGVVEVVAVAAAISTSKRIPNHQERKKNCYASVRRCRRAGPRHRRALEGRRNEESVKQVPPFAMANGVKTLTAQGGVESLLKLRTFVVLTLFERVAEPASAPRSVEQIACAVLDESGEAVRCHLGDGGGRGRREAEAVMVRGNRGARNAVRRGLDL